MVPQNANDDSALPSEDKKLNFDAFASANASFRTGNNANNFPLSENMTF